MNDPSAHRQTWELIPWMVNGTATDAQLASVRTHLQLCPDCSQELEYQRRLREAMTTQTVPTLDVQAGWQRLRARLGGDTQRPARAATSSARAADDESSSRARMRGWLAWAIAAIVVESALVGALSVALWSRPPAALLLSPARAPVYRTLASGETGPAVATIRAVLSPAMTISQVQALLRSCGLQAVGGPSEAGVWSLAPAPGPDSATTTESAIQRLRAHAEVRFAEPISAR